MRRKRNQRAGKSKCGLRGREKEEEEGGGESRLDRLEYLLERPERDCNLAKG